MRNRWKQIFTAATAFTMALSLMPMTSFAEEAKVGTPYTTEGVYDVGVPHVIVNQVYGGSNDGSASHSFIELYNQSEQAVDLNGWKLAYRSSASGDNNDTWEYLSLTGTIDADGFYLVRAKATEGTTFAVPEGEQEWDIALHNKGVSIVLLSEDTDLTDTFSGAVTDENRPEGYVDLLAVQGNDAEDSQMPPVYEGTVEPIQSKKKAVRRVDFADTDDNANDGEEVNYSKEVAEELQPHGKTEEGEADNTDADQEQTTPAAYRNNSFEESTELLFEKTGGITLGMANADGGVAEIVAYNKDNQKAYVVNGQDGVLNVFSVNSDGSLGAADAIQVKNLIDGFAYGDMTSVDVDTVNDHIIIALQAEDYAANGRIAVLDYDGNLVESYEAGVQPDMIKVSKDGKWILTANEGEPRKGYGEGIVDPEGSVTLVNTQTGEAKQVSFENFDSAELAEKGILFNKVDGQILSAAQDFEPEYIALNGDGTKAYISLQEANAIAIMDIESAKITDIKSLGFQDYSTCKIDLTADETYDPANYQDVLGVRMPDGISTFEMNGTTYLVTANEGDAREWDNFVNEAKATLTDTDGNEVKKVRVLDQGVTAGLDSSKNYLFGSRSFSIYNADTMELLYDSADAFESKTAEYLPTWFNCSNDDIEAGSRSQKKGPEAETVTVNRIGNKYYAFVGLERIGGIMVFDVTDPGNACYVNYINTRDFSEEIAGDVAPEGLAFVSSNDTASGKPILLAACEVSGTVAAYTITGTATVVPTPEEPDGSENENGDSNSDIQDDENESGSQNGQKDEVENADNEVQQETEVTSTVKTGDDANIMLLACVMAAALVGIVSILIIKKRR